jgi:hypothetical protein
MKRFREHASPDEPAPKRSVSDARKLSFAEAAALEGDAGFEPGCKLSQDTLAALEWMASRPPEEAPRCARKATARHDRAQVREEREGAVLRVLSMAHQFRTAGFVEIWGRGADPGVANVASGVNGPLFERLVADVDFHDPKCVDFFREVQRARGGSASRARRSAAGEGCTADWDTRKIRHGDGDGA